MEEKSQALYFNPFHHLKTKYLEIHFISSVLFWENPLWGILQEKRGIGSFRVSTSIWQVNLSAWGDLPLIETYLL